KYKSFRTNFRFFLRNKTIVLIFNSLRNKFWQHYLFFYFCSGELAEWSNAAVLKTVNCHRIGGSNPSLSAEKFLHRKMRDLCDERCSNRRAGVGSIRYMV